MKIIFKRKNTKFMQLDCQSLYSVLTCARERSRRVGLLTHGRLTNLGWLTGIAQNSLFLFYHFLRQRHWLGVQQVAH